jgi:hypothetical protein
MPENTDVTMTRLDRRTVVRTAANALWAVPAIQLASSVPAFAAASGRAFISIQSATGAYRPSDKSDKSGDVLVLFTVLVKNTGDGVASGTALTFTLTDVTGTTGTVASGWTGGASSAASTFTFTYGPQLVVGGPAELTFVLTKAGAQNKNAFNANVAATAISADGSSLPFSVAKG